jgi:hypothetical protein
MTQHEQIKSTILASPAYRRGNEITLTTVRDALGTEATGISRHSINKAVRALADTGHLVKTSTGAYTRCSRAGHWLRTAWRTTGNRELFGPEHDRIMAVAA